MAKLSSINKNERRKKMVKQYAPKYAKLKAQAVDKSLDDGERLIARLKMAELPRNANPTHPQPLRAYRAPARVPPQVPSRPGDAPRSGQQGPDPGRRQVELVRNR